MYLVHNTCPDFGFCKFLELRNDQIIASRSFAERTHMVMTSFLPSILKTTLSISLLQNSMIRRLKHTVGCQCKTEILVVQLFLFSSICNQVFDNLPVHQRLSSEEIHFQISSVPEFAIRKSSAFFPTQKTSALFFHDIRLLRKAISTGQIAVMCNMQAQCLYYGLSIFVNSSIIFS